MREIAPRRAIANPGLKIETWGTRLIGTSELLLVEHFWANGNGFGEVCWKSPDFRCLQLRTILGVCALLQRMESCSTERGVEQFPVEQFGYWQASQLPGFSREQAMAWLAVYCGAGGASAAGRAACATVVLEILVAGRERR